VDGSRRGLFWIGLDIDAKGLNMLGLRGWWLDKIDRETMIDSYYHNQL